MEKTVAPPRRLYGLQPSYMGVVDLDVTEFMYWLYCPIKAPHTGFHIPAQLEQFWPLVEKTLHVAYPKEYIYITAKRLWVTPDSPGNRPGWHSDGFMTNDCNFVWSDSNPTLFWEPQQCVDLTQDHKVSLDEMHEYAENNPQEWKTYPNKSLLFLDQYCIHRVADVKEAGMRTFVKISVSENKYDMEGNSKNEPITKDWKYTKRKPERNAPSSVEVAKH